MQKEAMQWTTFAIAVYGAALSSVTAWRSWQRDKPKIQLVPEISKTLTGKYRISFLVRNVGLIDSTITELGFTNRLGGCRASFRPSIPKDLGWPISIPAGEEKTIYVPAETMGHIFNLRMKAAYITIGHGIKIKSGSAALSYFLRHQMDIASDQEIEDSRSGAGLISSPHGLPKGRLLMESRSSAPQEISKPADHE